MYLVENVVGSKAASNGKSDSSDCWISGLRLVRYFKTASQTYYDIKHATIKFNYMYVCTLG